MNRFCPNKITCPGSDSPIANLSAEANDGPNFVSQQPRYSGNGFPEYVAEGCVAPCVSFVSQEDADLCALLQAYLCVNQPDDEPTIDPVVYNDMQVASSECPDGAIFSFFVAAGQFAAPNKEMANLLAFTYATEQAHAKRICLSEINGTGCEFEEFNQPIIVTGLNPPYTFTINSGSLPPGLALETLDGNTARITGIPSTPGSYTFTVQATDRATNFMQKTYTICVIGITPDPLPQAQLSTPYSQVLLATGCAPGPLSWQVTGGALPPGFTLNEATGVISGSCDTGGLYEFEITLQTEAT